MDDPEKILRQWLARESTLRTLHDIARRTEEKLASGRINVSGISPRVQGGSGGPNLPDRIEEIKAELAQFLLEKATHFGTRISAGEGGLESHILCAFINHLKDRVRNYTDDPYRYLYRRAREFLSASNDFHTALKSGRYLMFSLHPQNADQPPLTEEEILEIALPPGPQSRVDYKAACRQESMRHLAGHFWRQASSLRGGGPIWVDLRDFVDWMARHIAMPVLEQVDEGELGIESLAGSGDAGSAGPAEHLQSPEEALQAAEMLRLAGCFAGCLTAQEKAVCFLRDVLDLDWEEIAARTGYSGPSGPVYQYNKAERKMRAFIRDHASLSPEDFDPDDFRRFHREFLQILKECMPTP